MNLVTKLQSATHRIEFGQHLTSTRKHFFVCGLCFDYVKIDHSWGHAWPSVLCTLLFQPDNFHSDPKHLFKRLTDSIQLSYFYHMGHFEPIFRPTVRLLRDVTSHFLLFQKKIICYKVSSLVVALNGSCFSDIRWTAGCFKQIERDRFFSLAHFLNLLRLHFIFLLRKPVFHSKVVD